MNVIDTAPSRVASTPNGLSSCVSDNGADTVSVTTTATGTIHLPSAYTYLTAPTA
ncbi:hypothetical protein ABZW30_39380 [Kitasatospora sp. NPDC004669]|uniref:hypothetical protein n=1 Tax=Kitasatospora sp. NPDC004669 TaxID=3154555 RepID=UPI00339FFB06